MSQHLSSLKDHWLISILTILGMGFGASWFIAQEILVGPSKELITLQKENSTLNATIVENKRTAAQLNQSFEEAVHEKSNLQAQIAALKDDLRKEKADRIALKALQENKEQKIKDESNKELIVKMSLQRSKEEQILGEIENLRKDCQNQHLVDEILSKYRREIKQDHQ